jgi:flagella basal body P-ring formation protein FlgA
MVRADKQLVWVLSLAACAAASGATLEESLRAQRPDVERWEIAPLEARGEGAGATEVRELGRVGPRTAVRFADGRLRWFAVAGFAPALTAVRALDAGERAAPGDFTLAARDVIASGCEPSSALAAGQRWRLRARLTEGAVLCARMLEPVPDIERAQPVTLISNRPPIHITRVLHAVEDARRGERVRLRDADGNTIFAKATGIGTARPLEEQP